MKRIFTILLTIFLCATATAQIEHSIVLDRSTFRAVQTDPLTGVNIDPIGLDRSRRACARLKIFFHRMTREQMEQLEPVFPSGTIDYIKCKVAEGSTVLILEFTAKPNVKFYLKHPTFGTSNEMELSFEGDKEYQLEASLNQTFSIIVDSNVVGADVYLDGDFKGRTSDSYRCTISDVMVGEHMLKVSYSGINQEKKIVVNKNSISFRQNVDTAASAPQFVVFAVEPASAVVTIEGKHYSLQDGTMRTVLNAGTYSYTVSAVGYHSQSGTFTVDGQKVEKVVTLTADAATVTLTVADNAEIWVNGEKMGVGSWRGTLNSGAYIFEAKKSGYRTSTITKQITSTQPQQSYTLPTPTPIYGSIMVDGSPLMADIAIDGKAVGRTPLQLDNLLVGEHKLTVSKSGYQTYTATVTVAEGKTETVNAVLQKQNTAEELNAKGEEFYDKKDYTTAVEYYRKAAEQGDARAQFNLGLCYYNGDGVTQDYTEAVKWWHKAAEQGNAAAQNNLGACYENVYGVTQNYTEAVKWYRKAAEQGFARAQLNLGVCYANGRGVTYDYTEAAKWYRKAAEQGDADAQNRLGYCYEFGRGVTKSISEAVKWYRKAAEQGYVDAQWYLGACYQSGLGVTRDYTEAAKWYRKAAEQGHTNAQYLLGLYYENGRGVTQDYTEAAKWYRKAAEQGDEYAQNNLGYFYERGYGVTQDYTEAVKWYRKAAEQGHEKAQNNLRRLGY